MANFYRRHISSTAVIACPLTDLTRHDNATTICMVGTMPTTI